MGGKPAARQGDMTRKGLDIVQGSAGVLIGAPTGVACSVCPGGITYANPVNPLLGAKVLPGETDLALPGPLPFILSRAYSSYRTRTPAPVGVFGPGWKAPFDIRLQIRDEGLILNDSGGRSIHFEPLFPGEISYSRSESLWLARGGVAAQHSSQPLSALWQVLPEDVRLSPHVYLATNSLQGPWWILSWPERVPGADEVLPPEPPAYRVLTGVVDGFGRTLAFHRAAEGDVAGAVTGVTDGAGRRFHLVLTTQAQRAEVFRKQRATSLSSPAGPRSASSSLVFPDTLPAGTGYGTDNGIRLEAVWLTHDPAYPDEQPTAPLARYTYTAGGELRAVYDRSGTQVRGFTYDAEHAGRMVAHHYAGRPESCYRYDDTGRVTEQVNPEGLDYRFEYGESRVIITDSLNRREVLYTEGEGGLKRVVKKEHADGSITRSEYDEAGRLKAQTDAAGRRTEYSLHMASGAVTAVTGPDGRTVRYITPDPIGLRGGWNMYQYPLNPIQVIDPMGLDAIENMTSGGLIYAVSGIPGLIAANSITNSAYQFGYDMDAIVGGAHNGAADAMRHCYLMCRMTKTFGSTIADVIGKNHEAAGDRQGQPAKERIMDLKNNTVGIACGDFSAKCSDACIEKYNTGKLFGLDGIKADNPIKAKQGSSDASNY
ncbi:RHS repeat protein [Escherichia coli]|nr:RHS repeat protein [Escherichia coli]HDX3095695.1 RHS repeat protein [Escherichia coli]